MKAIITISKTFFPGHPRAGEATEFREKVLSGTKIHTCRQNYPYWWRQIERIQATDGILCVKQWIDRPYHQPGQEPIVNIPADVVGVQRLQLWRTKTSTSYDWIALVHGSPVFLEVLAANDGLTVEDFKAWFAPAFKKAHAEYLEFAIIHFTRLRY